MLNITVKPTNNSYTTAYERINYMNKYGPKAQEEVGKAMHEFKEGKLKNGSDGKKVTSQKQAVAIGLSQARKKGAKAPKKD